MEVALGATGEDRAWMPFVPLEFSLDEQLESQINPYDIIIT